MLAAGAKITSRRKGIPDSAIDGPWMLKLQPRSYSLPSLAVEFADVFQGYLFLPIPYHLFVCVSGWFFEYRDHIRGRMLSQDSSELFFELSLEWWPRVNRSSGRKVTSCCETTTSQHVFNSNQDDSDGLHLREMPTTSPLSWNLGDENHERSPKAVIKIFKRMLSQNQAR